MCCIVEIAMLVMGVIALVKGEVAFSKNKVIRGPAAYAIGTIMLITLPVVLAIGFGLGVFLVSQGHAQEELTQIVQERFWWIDLAVVGGALVVCFVIALVANKEPLLQANQRRAPADDDEVDAVDEDG